MVASHGSDGNECTCFLLVLVEDDCHALQGLVSQRPEYVILQNAEVHLKACRRVVY